MVGCSLAHDGLAAAAAAGRRRPPPAAVATPARRARAPRQAGHVRPEGAGAGQGPAAARLRRQGPARSRSRRSRCGKDNAGLNVSAVKLAGVVGAGSLLALVEAPDGIGYILKPGDALGDGRVTGITPNLGDLRGRGSRPGRAPRRPDAAAGQRTSTRMRARGTDLMRSARIAGLGRAGTRWRSAGIGVARRPTLPVQLKDVSVERARRRRRGHGQDQRTGRSTRRSSSTPRPGSSSTSAGRRTASPSRAGSPASEPGQGSPRQPVAQGHGPRGRGAEPQGRLPHRRDPGRARRRRGKLERAARDQARVGQAHDGASDAAKMAPKPCAVSGREAGRERPGQRRADAARRPGRAQAAAKPRPCHAPKATMSRGEPADKPAPRRPASPAPVSKEPRRPSASRPRRGHAAARSVRRRRHLRPPVLAQRPRPLRRSGSPDGGPGDHARRPAARGLDAGVRRKLISLDFKDADVVNLLRILAAESGRNIVAGDDVKGKVSVSLQQRDLGAGARHDPRGRGLAEGRAGRRDPHRLHRAAGQGARGAGAGRGRPSGRRRSRSRTKLAEAQLKEAEARHPEAARPTRPPPRPRLAARCARRSSGSPTPIPRKSPRPCRASSASRRRACRCPPRRIVRASRPSRPWSPGGRPLNPELGRLPQLNAPVPAAGAAARPQVVSVSQDVLAKGITIRANKATNSIFIRHYEADLERHQEAHPRKARRAAAAGQDRGADGDPRPQRARGHRRPVGRRRRRQRRQRNTLVGQGFQTVRDAGSRPRASADVDPNVRLRAEPRT